MESLYNSFKNEYAETPESAIKFFKENSLIFNNVTHFKNIDELYMFANVFASCINAFAARKQFKNALEALKSLPVIEKSIDEYQIDRAGFVSYKQILFQKGVSLYYLRDFKSAKAIFDKLQDYEPENDLLKNWIQHCKLRRLARFSYAPIVAVIIGISTDFIFKGQQYVGIHHISSIIVYTVIIASLLLMLYIHLKSIKKI